MMPLPQNYVLRNDMREKKSSVNNAIKVCINENKDMWEIIG